MEEQNKMNEDLLKYVIHLAVSMAELEHELKGSLDKLRVEVELVHRNNATLTKALNSLVEEKENESINS